MMNNLSRILLAALVVAGALIAYLFVGYGRMSEELEQARKQIEDTSHEAAQARKRLDEEVARVSREKEAELARLQQTHDDMVKSLEKEMQAGAVSITRLADRLTVNIVDKILFPSGEAAVSEDGRKVLGRVGQVLRDQLGVVGGARHHGRARLAGEHQYRPGGVRGGGSLRVSSDRGQQDRQGPRAEPPHRDRAVPARPGARQGAAQGRAARASRTRQAEGRGQAEQAVGAPAFQRAMRRVRSVGVLA